MVVFIVKTAFAILKPEVILVKKPNLIVRIFEKLFIHRAVVELQVFMQFRKDLPDLFHLTAENSLQGLMRRTGIRVFEKVAAEPQ